MPQPVNYYSPPHVCAFYIVKAAKANPYNPEVILYIGHYQRQIAGDVRYTVLCTHEILTHVDDCTCICVCVTLRGQINSTAIHV